MKIFLIALQFLTILPIKISARDGSAFGGKSDIEEKDFGKSLLYFPVIGMGIGMVLSLSVLLLGFLPIEVRGALILIISIVITGGIHLDGFADTCDGFYGSNPKEKILEIMRDSRLGVMGAVGIVSLLLLKFTLIINIPYDILWKPLVMMMGFSRWSQVLACYKSGYARKEGKARFFIEYSAKRELFSGMVFCTAVFLSLMKLKGLVLLALSIFLISLFINYIKRRIHGMTGDTIGAVSEVSELLILFGCLFLTAPNI